MMEDFLKWTEFDFDPEILTINPLHFLLPQAVFLVAAVSSLCLR